MREFYVYQRFLSYTLLVLLIGFVFYNFTYQIRIFAAEMGDGHNMPSANLGDRKTVLAFHTEPAQPLAGKNVALGFKLTDNKTGNNIQHVTYLVTVKKDEKRLFTETLHTHDGNMKILFVPDGTTPYKINANFDGLSASYISDFGSPIKINGPIFSTPGNYSVSLEVTGVDFDNLFLPTPLKFDFNIPVRG